MKETNSLWPIIIIIALLLIIVLILFNRSNTSNNSNSDIPETDETPIDEGNDPTADNREVSRSGQVAELVVVNSPTARATITSPVTIVGEAPGYWFFEATAPVSIVNWDGLIVGEGYITAEGEWMTENLVPFSGEVAYELDTDTPYNRGWVILQRHNASDLPENDAAVEIPVILQ